MEISRNPFHVRTSEQVGSDTRFLGLFGPGVLHALPEERLWDRLMIYRSTPGAGKTSILRLFTPGALRALHQNREQNAVQQLALQLEQWDVLGPDGPLVLGVLINCEQQYAALRDMGDDEAQRQRCFLALLNARIILAALRGALILAGEEYPRQVGEVSFEVDFEKPAARAAVDALGGTDGNALYARACTVERSICAMLDDLSLDLDNAPEGHADLWAIHMLGSRTRVGGRIVAERSVVMFDDLHLLHSTQRTVLRNVLSGHTLGASRWVAERWQGLEPEEVVAPGAKDEREYETVHLDGWADEGTTRLTRFEKIVTDIANRRARDSTLMQAEALHDDPFRSFLQELGDAPLKPRDLQDLLDTARERVESISGSSPRYNAWIEKLTRQRASTLDLAQEWRMLEILIQRDLGRRQRELFVDAELPTDDLDARTSSGVSAAAELFLAREQRIPYYYGARRLAQLASWNIEQFLDLAGEVFDLALTAIILKKAPKVSPRKQDDIIRAASKRLMAEIPRRVPSGGDVLALVQAVGGMSERETHRPTAPYAPGVNGFALSMADLERLRSATVRRQTAGADQLLRTLSAALANNIFSAQFNYRCKGKLWAVFYLNRLLCPTFNLPLHYGGYRERKLTEVIEWMRGSEGLLPEHELELGAR